MKLEQVTKSFGALSTQYGSGNSQFDMAIAIAGLVVLLIAVAYFLFGRSGGNYDYDEPLSDADIRYRLDDLTAAVERAIEEIRGDSGFLRQELTEIRNEIYLIKSGVEDSEEKEAA